MKNNKEPNIDETIKMLAELSRSYEKALECSNEVISMKNKYIVLCEQEADIYKKRAGKYGLSMIILSVILVITSVLLIYNL